MGFSLQGGDNPIKENSAVPQFFPVLEDQNRQRFHQHLDFKTVKNFKEEVATYGLQAPFTISMLESVAGLNLVPEDWKSYVKLYYPGGST